MDPKQAVVVETPTEIREGVREGDGEGWSPSSVRQLLHYGCAVRRDRIVQSDAATMRKMHRTVNGKCEACGELIELDE